MFRNVPTKTGSIEGNLHLTCNITSKVLTCLKINVQETNVS